MLKKISGLLLLLLPFSVLSEPLITCVPDSYSTFKTYLNPALAFVILFGCLIIATYTLLFENKRKFRPSKAQLIFVFCFDSVIIGLFIALANYTLHLVPAKKAVVNESVMMSAPEVKKGLHYQTECLLVSQNDTSVERRCRPDAVSETVTQVDYFRATDALTKAEDRYVKLMMQARRSNICQPENTPSFFSFSALFPNF